MLRLRSFCVLLALAVVVSGGASCGGAAQPAPASPQHGQLLSHLFAPRARPNAAPTPAPPPPADADAALVATGIDHPPQIYPPAWKKVGIGQTISFSTAAIDEDLDETAVTVTKAPLSAAFDPITQTITWTPTASELGKQTFELAVHQPRRELDVTKSFAIEVMRAAQPEPVAERRSAVIESLLLIREPARLAEVNQQWPIDKLLLVGAQSFRYQIPVGSRGKLEHLDKDALYTSFLVGLAKAQNNPRLDPYAPEFDRYAFDDPSAWRLVAFRPRIDKAWTELRVVYQAVNAPEPVFAMFRLRPGIEYVPPTAGPAGQRDDDNKTFLAMVAKHLLDHGAPSQRLYKDPVACGKAVAALMTEVMGFEDPAHGEWRHGFEIGIAVEARMGGGSARNPDGSYRSGDGWGWSAMKPFITADLTNQRYVNVPIPGFWTQTQPSADGTTWDPVCAGRYATTALCRKTLGFVDLPDKSGGTLHGGKVDANNLYREHKLRFSVEKLALEDGRRDLGEENGMTCSECHIRNFGMHDWHDAAAVDPRAGLPKAMNHAIQTLNFQIIPTTTWEAFTLEFLQHQECRAKAMYEHYFGKSALTCPLLK